MFQHQLAAVCDAEHLATSGAPVEEILGPLRRLAMEEFGELMISLPTPEYAGLSDVLPAMASEQIQETWTGNAGLALLRQTTTFVRQLQVHYTQFKGESLYGKTILDFGCGYGRMMRLMYYFTDPHNLWGIDAWEKSLGKCREAGVLGHLAKSESFPSDLPVGSTRFDLGYAFSVFTHLSPRSADACLNAVRRCMKPGGLFVVTVRPVEFWPFIDKRRGTTVAAEKVAEHVTESFAYLPHPGTEGEAYGDASYPFEFFDRPGWKRLGYDWSRIDAYQLSVILQAV